MDNSFFAYLQKLELLTFFPGYPLVYAVVFFLAENNSFKNNFTCRVRQCLPFGYALVGTLYTGLLLKNLYPDYSFQHTRAVMQLPWLTAWAVLSLCFWIPALAKKKLLSLLHSIVFFLVLLSDLLSHISASDVVHNDMNVYTISLLLNTAAVLLISVLYWLFARNKFHFRA